MLHDKTPLDSTFFRSIFFRKLPMPIGYKCISVEIESGLIRHKLFRRWKYRESREIVGAGKWRRPADKGQSIERYGGRFDEGFAWQRNHWRLRMTRDRWWYWYTVQGPGRAGSRPFLLALTLALWYLVVSWIFFLKSSNFNILVDFYVLLNSSLNSYLFIMKIEPLYCIE